MTNAKLSAQLELIYGHLCDARGQCSSHPDYHDGSPIEALDQWLEQMQEQTRERIKRLQEPEGKKP